MIMLLLFIFIFNIIHKFKYTNIIMFYKLYFIRFFNLFNNYIILIKQVPIININWPCLLYLNLIILNMFLIETRKT